MTEPMTMLLFALIAMLAGACGGIGYAIGPYLLCRVKGCVMPLDRNLAEGIATEAAQALIDRGPLASSELTEWDRYEIRRTAERCIARALIHYVDTIQWRQGRDRRAHAGRTAQP